MLLLAVSTVVVVAANFAEAADAVVVAGLAEVDLSNVLCSLMLSS